MKVEFDINLSEKDLYRFSMYHNYTSLQGLLSIFVGVGAFAAAIFTRDRVETTYTLLYLILGAAILIYMPATLRISTKHQMARNAQLRQALHYLVDETGVTVKQSEEVAELPWTQVYRMKETKRNILIYSTRINAFILPKEQLSAETLENLKKIGKDNLETYRYSIRRGK